MSASQGVTVGRLEGIPCLGETAKRRILGGDAMDSFRLKPWERASR